MELYINNFRIKNYQLSIGRQHNVVTSEIADANTPPIVELVGKGSYTFSVSGFVQVSFVNEGGFENINDDEFWQEYADRLAEFDANVIVNDILDISHPLINSLKVDRVAIVGVGVDPSNNGFDFTIDLIEAPYIELFD